jgi:hypothetical protein
MNLKAIFMKRSINKLLVSAVIISSIFTACKKKEEATPVATTPTTTTTAPTTTTTPTAAAGFTWQENGGATITADSAFWTTGTWGTGIRAYKAGMANMFEINWATQNNTSVGAKTLNIGTYSDFTFMKGSATYTNATVQTLNVTAFSGNNLSGNFTVAVSGGSITSISGTFTAIPLK